MHFRRFTTYLLVTTFTFQTCLPIYAMQDIGDVTNNIGALKQGALPSRLAFKANREQTAAGCLFYARHENEIKVLLGFRDEDTYCNPGGKSDKEDETLAGTATREGGEETFNIYCPHRDFLNTQPFVDLYSLKPNNGTTDSPSQPFLNRMYFVEQQYVDAAIFNERLKSALTFKLSKHSQEYRHFTWVPVKDILEAIQKNTPTFTPSNTAEEITLFQPLFQSLMTETSQNLLHHLVINKTIPSFSTKKNPLIKNRLHLEGTPQVDMSAKVSWTLPIYNFEEIVEEATKEAEKRTATANAQQTGLLLQEEVSKTGKNAFENVIFPPQPYQTINFDQDASGSSNGQRTIHSDSLKKPLQQIVSFDAQQNRFLMGKAVAAKAAAHLKIKSMDPLSIEKQNERLAKLKTFKTLYFDENGKLYNINTSEESLPLPLYPVIAPELIILQDEEDNTPTLSDLLLQVQLGTDYVKPLDPKSALSRRQADIENLKLYHKRSFENEGELKRDTKPLNTDFERIADVLELERQHKKWLPMHHASKPEAKFLPITNTVLRELLAINPAAKGTNPGVRATDIYFRGHSTMAISVGNSDIADYQNGNMNRRLCANMAVTSGLRTTYTSSNSVEYFFNSHSVQMPDTLRRFEEGTQLLGMVATSYLPYQSLYEQYFGCVSKDVPNSAWTVVFVQPEALDAYSYPSFGGGHIFYLDNPEDRTTVSSELPSTQNLYKRAHRELSEKIAESEKGTLSISSSSSRLEKLAKSVAEVRLLLHPSLMWDPEKSKTFSIDRFPLTEPQQKVFRNLLTSCTISDVGRWLSDHTQIMADSLYEKPVIKKLYGLVHQGLTGQPVQETVSVHAFSHLIRNGHAEGVQQFFESYPEIVQKIALTPHELTLLAINSGNVDTLKVVLDIVLKTSVDQILSKEDIIALVRACISKGDDSSKGNMLETHAYVFQNYDLSTIDEKIKRSWGVEILANGSAETLDAFHQHVFPITEDMIDEGIRASLSSNSYRKWKGLTKFTTPTAKQVADYWFLKEMLPLEQLSPSAIEHLFFHDQSDKRISQIHLAEKFLKYFTQEHLAARSTIELALKRLIQNGLSYTAILPSSGNPLLFFIPYFTSFSSTVSEDKHLFDTLVKDPLFFEYKNQEGLTLIPFLQKNFLRGQGKPEYFFIENVLKKQLEAKKEAGLCPDFYPPFVEEFGTLDICNICTPSPFSDPIFMKWHEKLGKARNENSQSKIKEAFRTIPNPEHLRFYLYDKLGNFDSSIYNIQKERQAQLILSYNIPDLLNGNPEEFLSAVESGQITQSNMMKVTYSLTNENADVFEKALPTLFPNALDLVTLKSDYGYNLLENVIHAHPLQGKTLKTLLQYGGCFPLLSQLTDHYFNLFLSHSPAELLSFVEKQCPDIFAHHDDQRNFLALSCDFKRFQNIEFVMKHLKELKEMFDEDGIPLIFTAIGQDLPLLMKIITQDPTILKLTTKEGLGVEQLLTHFIPQDSEYYEEGKKLLAYYKSLDKTL